MPAPSRIDDPLALERQVCFALAVASRTVISVYRPVLEPLGLTHPQYLVMLALWEEEPLSVTELSRRLELDPGTLSRLLKRLETAGLVRRDRNPADERSLALALTPRGRELRTRALDVPAAVLARLDMDVDELMQLRDRLTDVIGAAKAATETPAP
ncbi:MarR family winged helix-turn-helix transcriptional regulator [Nocardioides pinisoli]|uniref:MarR family transcriptional regulator n=1 Tax=Nocardioides pinisoli TaxID=2950279 RepID=A0ABT1KZM4_9ACTN|nr:MarR family transcriptional regulator [Nocardioides pinisoli]MCP3422061.1 MarR family transcriptional regulator [Nocardioides pinisoli]